MQEYTIHRWCKDDHLRLWQCEKPVVATIYMATSENCYGCGLVVTDIELKEFAPGLLLGGEQHTLNAFAHMVVK